MLMNLVIAPTHPDLAHLPDEGASIANALQAHHMAGDVRMRTVFDYFLMADDIDVVWICTHGDADGLWLYGGEYLRAFDLGGLLLARGVKELVLNSCWSHGLIHEVQATAPVAMVTTILDVPDASAWAAARSIALRYKDTENLRLAVAQVSPLGSGLFRYYPAPLRTSGGGMSDDQWKASVDRRLAEMDRRQARLWLAVMGDDVLGAKTIREEVREINEKLDLQHSMSVWWRIFGAAALTLTTVASLIIIWQAM